MPTITINITTSIDVPEGVRLVRVPTGEVNKILLPNGAMLRPWIEFEESSIDGEYEDAAYQRLCELGIDGDFHIETEISGDDINIIDLDVVEQC